MKKKTGRGEVQHLVEDGEQHEVPVVDHGGYRSRRTYSLSPRLVFGEERKTICVRDVFLADKGLVGPATSREMLLD